MISRQSVIDVLKERQNFYAERNQDRQFFTIANVIDDVLNLPSENPWHTGIPTEEGWYLLYTSKPNASYHLAFYQFDHWFSTDEYCIIREDVVAWMPITPYEEN